MVAPHSPAPRLDRPATPPPRPGPSLQPTPPRRRARWPRLLVALLLLACLAVGLTFGLRAVLTGEAMQARVRARVAALLDERLGGGTVGEDYAVDRLGRVRVGPLRLGAPGEAPVLTVGWALVRPSYRALLSGKVEPASILLHDVRLDAGPKGERLEAWADRLKRRPRTRRAATVAPRALPLLRFDTLEVSATHPGFAKPLTERLERGRVELRHSVVGGELSVRAALATGGGLEAKATWTPAHHFSFDVALTGAGPRAIPETLREALPFQISSGTFTASARTLSLAGAHRGAVRVALDASDLTLSGPRLAGEPVGPMRVGLEGDVRWDTAWRRVMLENGALMLGPNGEATVGLSAELTFRGPTRFSVSARAERLGYQKAIDALPSALRPPADAPRLDGTLNAALAVSGPVKDPDAWKVEAKLDLSALRKAARQQAPLFLERPFEYRAVDGEGRETKVWVGPKNPDFVPFSQLPTYVYRAVTTSEDAGFFAHHGFDFDELKNSIVADVVAGRSVRGGSTITQQLSKNLFLSREKTYARKVQEAFITLALEASLPKQRLLEIYLNLIEWGPGIHGIGAAARHYFGKDARALTPKEAAFLATIIPNPIRYHMYYERGALSEVWEKHVTDLLTRLTELKVLAPDELAPALATPLVFAKPEPSPSTPRR